MMQQNRVWGSEVEILAASAILETILLLLNTTTQLKDLHMVFTIRWCRYNASNSYDSSFAIYIANFRDHYESVISLINSGL